MIRLSLSPLLGALAVSAVVSASAFAQTSAVVPATAAPKPAAKPTCTYGGRTYSDGAFVCVEKSLMLKCAADDAKATWSVVADKDLGDKCRGPAVRESVYQRRARWHRQNIRREISPPD